MPGSDRRAGDTGWRDAEIAADGGWRCSGRRRCGDGVRLAWKRDRQAPCMFARRCCTAFAFALRWPRRDGVVWGRRNWTTLSNPRQVIYVQSRAKETDICRADDALGRGKKPTKPSERLSLFFADRGIGWARWIQIRKQQLPWLHVYCLGKFLQLVESNSVLALREPIDQSHIQPPAKRPSADGHPFPGPSLAVDQAPQIVRKDSSSFSARHDR